MRRFRAVSVTTTATAPALALGSCAFGYSFFQDQGATVVWPNGEAIRYLSPSTFPEGSDADVQFLAAMGEWSSVPIADFQYFFVRNDEDYPVDHFDGFSDTLAVPASELDPGVLAVTVLVNNGAEWFDADMLFSDLPDGVGYSFETNPSCDVLTAPTPTNGYVFALVAIHELGHGIGLGHDPIGDEAPGTPWFVATMNPRYPNGGTMGQESIIELHTDDRNGTRFLYPNSGPSNPPHVDLAVAGYTAGEVPGRAVPIFFDPPTAGPEDELTVRSVIENLGSTSIFGVRQGFYLSTDPTIETTDLLVGTLDWDVAFEDGFDFDVTIDLPFDLPSGTYHVGSIIDDLGAITEVFEDNNAVAACTTLEVDRLVPVIETLGQVVVPAGVPFTGPTPAVTRPLNMGPITWSLDNPEPGMTIDEATGVVTWPDPVAAQFPYVLVIRATNDSGTSTQLLFVGVEDEPVVCPGDLDGNGFIGLNDLTILLNAWGPCPAPPLTCTPDFNGNGHVDLADLTTLLNAWGPCAG